MAKRDIGKEIAEGLEDIKARKRGERRLGTATIDPPSAAEVAAIRNELGLSQEQFAGLLGVSAATLRNWEQRRREPHGAARSLLLVASREPSAVLRALAAGTYGTRERTLYMTEKAAPYRVLPRQPTKKARKTSKRQSDVARGIERLRGSLKHIRMSTDEIMALTRGED